MALTAKQESKFLESSLFVGCEKDSLRGLAQIVMPHSLFKGEVLRVTREQEAVGFLLSGKLEICNLHGPVLQYMPRRVRWHGRFVFGSYTCRGVLCSRKDKQHADLSDTPADAGTAPRKQTDSRKLSDDAGKSGAPFAQSAAAVYGTDAEHCTWHVFAAA